MGIPMVTDVRLFYFNRTTFDTLGLKYPPPHADWGPDYTKTWTWKKMVEYAIQIKQHQFGSGFQLFGSWDEEMKWLTIAAREYNAQLFTGNMSCGFNSESFQSFLKEIVVPLFSGVDSVADPRYVDTDSNEFKTWLSKPLGSSLDREYMPGFDTPGTIPGMAFYST